MITFSLGIPHTPWIPERRGSLLRLKAALGIDASCLSYTSTVGHDQPFGDPTHGFRQFSDRELNSDWSEKLWTWGLETGADYLVQLQDDAVVTPDFWAHLVCMVDSTPGRVLGLESVHDRASHVLANGSNWYTTSDMLIGVGYVVPRPILAHFLNWRSTRLVDGWQCNEDTLLGVYCLSTGTRIYHPVPTIIDHDTSLPSTYGNDLHTHRRPILSTVRGDAVPALQWGRPTGRTPHLGRFYSSTPELARRLIKESTQEHYNRMVDDIWRGEYT